jgi:peptidoglycan-associated lipoprotein
MKKANVGLVAIMILGLIFLTTGCAKKAAPKAEEVKPPVTQELKVEQPAPAPEKPKEEAQVVAPAPMPGLEDEIKSFEDKDIYFDFDKFSLMPESKEILAQKAEFLKAHANMSIQIQGNCDERGTTEYNLALGERRAKSAHDYLVSLGVAKEHIATISYGKEKPVDPGHDEAAWAKNRNDHFIIVNK